jgi:Domain of unknown function (DUF7014)/AbiJ N-terminal domain 4
MPILDLYSKRQRRLRGEVPDVYEYERIPEQLRVQIIHIWRDALGDSEEYFSPYYENVRSAYQLIVESLCREYGVFRLWKGEAHRDRNFMDELIQFFLREENVDKVIDAIELTSRVIDQQTRGYLYLSRQDANAVADQAITELNERLREHGIGFQYVSGEVIRVDSEFLHQETIKPALRILSQSHMAGAQEEFLRAHEHYRKGRTKEALNEALKSLESTLKAILDRRGWEHPPNATCKNLLDKCFAEDLIPAFWQSHMSAIRSLLEGGVPTARNKLGGHGQGVQPTEVPDYIVSYVLHMTAAAIVFLANADEAKS